MRDGFRKLLIVLATGGGKTAIAAHMTSTSIARGVGPVWFLVHRRELLRQTAGAFYDAGIDVGIVAAGREMQPWRKCQVVLVDSLKRRRHLLPDPRIIVADEAHHAIAKKWATAIQAYPKAWLIGLTATPERLDGRGLGEHFDRIVEGPSMRWLIDNGFLSDYRIFAPPSVNTVGVHTVAGDFNKAELRDLLEKSTIVGDAVHEYRKHAAGRRAIIRSLSRDGSRAVCAAFQSAGFSAAHVDGLTPDDERVQVFNAFKAGDLEVLCNVELFSEGVDVPGVECVIDLRPTKSLSMYLQFIGRALRPVYAPGMDLSTTDGRLAAIAAGPKPVAIILDHAGNVDRHGLPDDEREWSLDGRKKREVKKTFTCKVCYAVYATYQPVCPSCGAIPERLSGSGRAGPQQVAGELGEVDKEAVRKRRQYAPGQRQARSLAELEAYALATNKKKSWATYVFNARLQKLTRA